MSNHFRKATRASSLPRAIDHDRWRDTTPASPSSLPASHLPAPLHSRKTLRQTFRRDPLRPRVRWTWTDTIFACGLATSMLLGLIVLTRTS